LDFLALKALLNRKREKRSELAPKITLS